MTAWTLEKGQRVDVDRMGAGTVTKVTAIGAMVSLDQYKIEVEIQKDWMRPLEGLPPIVVAPTPPPEPEPSALGVSDGTNKHLSEAALRIIGAMGINNTEVKSGTTAGTVKNTGTDTGPRPEPVALPVVTPPLPASPPADPTVLAARRAIESLRFGLVPHGFIEKLTLGYDELKIWSRECLPAYRQDKPGMYKIVGPFGTGKSHTIAVLRHISEQEGYLTAKIEVDGRNYSLSEPARLLHTLLGSLHGQGFESESPVVQLYKMALAAGHTDHEFRRHSMIKAADNMYTVGRLLHAGALDHFEDNVEAILSGSDEFSTSVTAKQIEREFPTLRYHVRLHPPIMKAVYVRGANFVEALVSTAKLSQMAGYRGLILFIDEFEVEAGNLTNVGLAKVLNQLRLIGGYMSEETVSTLPAVPLSLVFGTVGDDYDRAESEINNWMPSCRGSSFRLHVWEQEERQVLARKIYELYQLAYHVQDPFRAEMASSLEQILTANGGDDSGYIRRFIKWYVSILDMHFGPPGGTSL